jgi:hypothetical protein
MLSEIPCDFFCFGLQFQYQFFMKYIFDTLVNFSLLKIVLHIEFQTD